MTIKELIEELTEIASGLPRGMETEVVAINEETGEAYTPVISYGPDVKGYSYLMVC